MKAEAKLTWRKCVVLIGGLCSLLCTAASADETIYLGVLENFPSQRMRPGNTSDSVVPAEVFVRVCFVKTGSGWKVAKEYPARMSWTVAFDGKTLGQITSRNPDNPQDAKYYKIGRQELVGYPPIPTVGKPSREFSGSVWKKSLRPLVVVSQSSYQDPEHWRPSELSDAQVRALKTALRVKHPEVSNCRNPYENIERLWKYTDEDIRIKKVYSSEKQWLLAKLKLDSRCDYWDEPVFSGEWYTISPDGTTRYLAEGLQMVDAGDYDGDGKSEVIFKIGRGEAGAGYEIYYDEFRKHAALEFVYH